MSSVPSNNRSFHNTDQPYALPNDGPEWERLDNLHRGCTEYFGGKLTLAPIKSPKKILDIGSGSGAWAIQAAQTYPEAEVLAIDISPLPPRPLPSNLKYENFDATEPFPFDPASFDVVHVRFVLMHLPDFSEVLSRIAQLVNPGGFLLLEDAVHDLFGDIGPGIIKFFDVYNRYTRSRGGDERAAQKLELLLKESGVFTKVHTHRIEAPFSEQTGDPKLGALGQVVKTTLSRAYKVLDPKLVAFGMTQQVQDGFYQELEDSARSLHVEIYINWAQKKE